MTDSTTDRHQSVALDNSAAVEAWLRTQNSADLQALWSAADRTRQDVVGDAVQLRGLIEVSNICVRLCAYCGVNRDNRSVTRYRMTRDEILTSARLAAEFGYGTVVMQSGEDEGITGTWMAEVIREIKSAFGLAITLSLGERSEQDLAMWREAGADRYLLRFETSDPNLYRAIHPDLPGRISDRIALLRTLREIGYEIGSGVMIGLPGQSFGTLAHDLMQIRDLDLDMIGVGPYIPHPATSLARNEISLPDVPADDHPIADEVMTCKVIALARLLCPEANIPATTALATISGAAGRLLGLQRGANVIMPNVTPAQYRRLYEIYPAKASSTESPDETHQRIMQQLAEIGRPAGQGPGGRSRRVAE